MAEEADWNLGWEQSKLRWEESCRKMKELAEQLTVSLGHTIEELKQLREEREALDSEIVEELLVPSQPKFSKEPDEMPNGCLENAVPAQENTVNAPFSDSEQELDVQKVFDELSHLDSNFGVPSNLGVNVATIQINVEQPIENPKIEDWNRNILGKPPEDSNLDSGDKNHSSQEIVLYDGLSEKVKDVENSSRMPVDQLQESTGMNSSRKSDLTEESWQQMRVSLVRTWEEIEKWSQESQISTSVSSELLVWWFKQANY